MRAQDIDAAMNTIDDACLRGDYETAEAAIVATCGSPIAVGLAALMISMPWRERLADSRSAVVVSIRDREPDRADDLLHGLIA